MSQDLLQEPPSSKPIDRLTRTQCTILFALGSFLLVARVWAASSLYLFPDEALYIWQGFHVPLGFDPHPPGAPLLARAGVTLLGHRELGVRLFSIVFSTLIYFPVFLLAQACANVRAAFWATLLCMSVPFFLLFGCVDTPDTPQLLLWTIALLLTWHALQTDRTSIWLGTGAVIGIGLYIKYIIILFFPSLLICCLVVPEYRKFLRRPGPYLCLSVALALFLPVAIWQESRTHWDAIRYHLQERQKLSFSLKQFMIYHGLHAGYLSPLIYVGAIAAMVASGMRALKRRDRTMAFLFAFSAFPYVFFAAIAAITKRELSREQWDAISYIPALIAAGIFVREACDGSGGRLSVFGRKSAVSAATIGLFMCVLLWSEAAIGAISSMLHISPLFSTVLGWKEMAGEVDRAFASFPEPANSFLLGSSFWEAFEYDFYRNSYHHLYVHHSNNDDKYGVWNLLVRQRVSRGAMRREIGNNGVYVENDIDDKSARSRFEKLSYMFERVEPFSQVPVRRSGRTIGIFRIYRCYSLKRAYISPQNSGSEPSNEQKS